MKRHGYIASRYDISKGNSAKIFQMAVYVPITLANDQPVAKNNVKFDKQPLMLPGYQQDLESIALQLPDPSVILH